MPHHGIYAVIVPLALRLIRKQQWQYRTLLRVLIFLLDYQVGDVLLHVFIRLAHIDTIYYCFNASAEVINVP